MSILEFFFFIILSHMIPFSLRNCLFLKTDLKKKREKLNLNKMQLGSDRMCQQINKLAHFFHGVIKAARGSSLEVGCEKLVLLLRDAQ